MDLLLGVLVLVLVIGIILASWFRSSKRNRGKSQFEKMMEPRPDEAQFTQPPVSDGWGGGDSQGS